MRGLLARSVTIVDDAGHDAMAIEIERAVSGEGVSKLLDRLAL